MNCIIHTSAINTFLQNLLYSKFLLIAAVQGTWDLMAITRCCDNDDFLPEKIE